MFSSSKTKHKEVWEVGAEVQRLIVDRCSYKCLHNPVWERIKNVAIHYHKTHLNFSLKCSFVRGTCEIKLHLKFVEMQFTSFWGICQDLLCKLGIQPGGGTVGLLPFRWHLERKQRLIVDRCSYKCLHLSLIHIWRCRRSTLCRSRWSPYH